MKIINYDTGKVIEELKGNINAWCNKNDCLVHHKTKAAYYVIVRKQATNRLEL